MRSWTAEIRGPFAALALGLVASAASAQLSLSLDELGIAPRAAVVPAEQMRACLDDPAQCSRARTRGVSLDDVVNLGIVDRGTAPVDPSPSRGAGAAGNSDVSGAAREVTVLPSIDMSAYLSGEAPARSIARTRELAELAAVLAADELVGFDVVIVVSGDATAQDRAQEIARALSDTLDGRLRVVAEAGTAAGITLALSPSQ